LKSRAELDVLEDIVCAFPEFIRITGELALQDAKSNIRLTEPQFRDGAKPPGIGPCARIGRAGSWF
jgi:hypothetical protein